jgi:hypothetical protein
MSIKLAPYALVGVEAVPVDVLLDGERARVDDLQVARVLRSVRLESSGSVWSVGGHVVNVRTYPLRKRARRL